MDVLSLASGGPGKASGIVVVSTVTAKGAEATGKKKNGGSDVRPCILPSLLFLGAVGWMLI